jgi:hypothetical protein
MGRYVYLGPYDIIEFEDLGTKKTLTMGGTYDIEDEAFVNDQIRRGFHLFRPVEDSSPVESEPVAEPEPAQEESSEEQPES